jgi:hypothetical protein
MSNIPTVLTKALSDRDYPKLGDDSNLSIPAKASGILVLY